MLSFLSLSLSHSLSTLPPYISFLSPSPLYLSCSLHGCHVTTFQKLQQTWGYENETGAAGGIQIKNGGCEKLTEKRRIKVLYISFSFEKRKKNRETCLWIIYFFGNWMCCINNNNIHLWYYNRLLANCDFGLLLFDVFDCTY